MKAGNLDSEEGTMTDKTSCDQGVKNVGKCTCLGHVTLSLVSYGGFHIGQMTANY